MAEDKETGSSEKLSKLLLELQAALRPLAEAPSNVNATSALPDDIRESVAVDNLKTIAGAYAAYSANAFGNHVSHQKRLDILAEKALAVSVGTLDDLKPEEARSISRMMSGNDLGQQLAQLRAVVDLAVAQTGKKP